MQMINVLQRLAELDSKNPNVANPLAAGKKVMEADQMPQLPELKSVNELKALSGLKPVAECGIMELGGGEMMNAHPRPPASFSINATAADGAEVSSMLSDILNLAGVHKVGDEHMPAVDGPQTSMIQTAPMAHGMDAKDAMRSALDKMNAPGDEMHDMDEPEDGAMDDMPMTDEEEMPMSTAGFGDAGGAGAAEPMSAQGLGSGGTDSPVSSMADEIRDMADKLSQIEDKEDLPGLDKDQKADEAYNNTPADPTNVPLGNSNDFSYNPNMGAGASRHGLGTQPTAMAEDLEDQLYSEYKKFVSEAKADCCCEEKGKKACPVHGKKKANEGLNHNHAGPKIEHADVEACVKCAETMGVALEHENMQALHDCMESFPKFHKHITNKYNECWEDFHTKCCEHYHNRNGHEMIADEDHTGQAGVAGPGIMAGGGGSYGMYESKKKKGDGNLANNYPPYDKVTRGDVIAGAKGQDQMGGKKKTKEGDDKSLSKAAKTVKKGALHKQEGIPQDKKIGTDKLKSLKKRGTPLEKKRANFALNIQGKGKK